VRDGGDRAARAAGGSARHHGAMLTIGVDIETELVAFERFALLYVHAALLDVDELHFAQLQLGRRQALRRRRRC
jgi:hypothetical protein